MYSVRYTAQFKKDLKLCVKRGLDIDLIRTAITILTESGKLPPAYKPHVLHGKRAGQWECHIKPDWLMVWEQSDEELTILMLNTGTHSDLF